MSRESATAESPVEAARRFLDGPEGVPGGAGIVVAVSGGADSVALLAVLRRLAGEGQRAYALTVAHVDHGLRSGSADDAAFVADLARKWDLPCIVERLDAAAEAKSRRIGIEEAARLVRYACLERAAKQAGCDYVAVAHHADDNVETVLHRILRGCHLRGLIGMPARRPLGQTPVTLIRPLLRCRRAEIERFCRRGRLVWRTDPTNAQTGPKRNFIRHELLPAIRGHLNARVDEALLRLAAAACDAEAVLTDRAGGALDRAVVGGGEGGLTLDAAVLADEPPAVRAAALRSALQRLGVGLRGVTAERLVDLARLPLLAPPAAVTLPGGFEARRAGSTLAIERPVRPGPPEPTVALACPGQTHLPDGATLTCSIEPLDPAIFKAHCRAHRPGIEYLDAGELRGPLHIRPRQDGDTFRPLGAPGSQSVSDFLTNLKLPRRRRGRVRCICDDGGIVYLAGLRIDDRVKVTDATTRVLRIELTNGPRAVGVSPCIL